MSGRFDRLFFLGLWLLYGVLINAHDLQSFNLQQLGVESLVERGRFSVEGSSTPQLQPGGDVFDHDGHLFAAKQPGQFIAGALAYAPLHALGLSYAKNFLLVAALVTWATASLATAAAALAVLRLARAWSAPAASRAWPWLAALTFAFATTALPYAGVAHHDAIATAYLVGAFYFAWQLHAEFRIWRALFVGLLLGATLTTSMLPAPMVVVVAVYAIMQGPERLQGQQGPGDKSLQSMMSLRSLGWLGSGFAIGLAPLLLYNWHSFGNPLLPPNLAGDYADTYPYFEWRNVTGKLAYYAEMITLYVPVAWAGIAGLALLPSALRREQMALAGMLLALAAYVCNIETLGGCQYGPRYLLPAMPFVALGVVGFTHLHDGLRRVAAVALLPLVTASSGINLLGALYGAMFCDLRLYGFTHYLTALRLGIARAFPLALWLTIPIGLWIVAAVRAVEGERRA